MRHLRQSQSLAATIALVGACIAVLVSWNIAQNTRAKNESRFIQLTERLSSQILKRVRQYEYGLRGARSLFVGSNSVTYDEFKQMVLSRDLTQEFPGSLGFGFIQIVHDQRIELEPLREELISQGSPAFTFSEPRNAAPLDGSRVPGKMIIKFIEPHAANKTALGLDIGSEPVRREAAERAYLTNSAAITGRIQLVQAEADATGFLYLLPCFNPKLPKNTPSEKLDAFLGWTYMPIIASDALKDVEDVVDGELIYSLYDGRHISSDNLIARSRNSTENATGTKSKKSMTFEIGGRLWTLEMLPSEVFQSQATSLEKLALIGGIALSLLLGALVWSLSEKVDRAEEKTRGMSKDLRRLAMVAERTTNAVVITDQHRKVVWVNDGFSRLTEYTFDEVQGKTPGAILQFSGTDQNTVSEIRKRLNACEGFCGAIQNQSKSGKPYWVNIDIQPLRDENDEFIGFLSIENDVTQAKEFAEALQRERDRTELALAGGKLGIWTLDFDCGEFKTDQRWTEILGHSDDPDAHSIVYWFGRMPEEDCTNLRQSVRQCIVSNSNLDVAVRIHRMDDTLIWLHLKGQMTSQANGGKKNTLAGTVMEITANKHAELALRESEARATTMFLASHDAILLMRDGFVSDCNARAVTMLDRTTKAEIIGRLPIDFSPPFQRDGKPSLEMQNEYIGQAIKNGYARFDWTLAKPDGQPFEVEVVLSRLYIGGEHVVQATVRDISERRELERQLSQAQKLESIGQLAAGVAHEINTPMQCVFSNVEYLQRSLSSLLSLTSSYRQFYHERSIAAGVCENIEILGLNSRFDKLSTNITDSVNEAAEGADRVIEIVRAMKTMSHPGTNSVVATDLNKLIQDASVISRNRWKYVARIEMDLDDSLGMFELFPAQMSQVMLNLIVNAADAIVERIGEEPVELGCIRVTSKKQNDGVTIEITDNGNGMPSRVLDRIFDPFFTTKDVGKGTGQGLSIAYDVVVNQHRGRISASSKEGIGTTFSIWLPVAQIAMNNETPVPSLAPNQSLSSDPSLC